MVCIGEKGEGENCLIDGEIGVHGRRRMTCGCFVAAVVVCRRNCCCVSSECREISKRLREAGEGDGSLTEMRDREIEGWGNTGEIRRREIETVER